LPFKDAEGRIDLPHLRNALARLNQTQLPKEAKEKARRVLCAAARQVGLKSEVCGAEEAKTADSDSGIVLDASGVVPEPTLDDVIASVEAVLGEVEDAIEALTARIERLEAYVKASKNVGGGSSGGGSGSISAGSGAEGLLVKNAKPMIPVEDVAKMIRDVLPSPMVERSWGLGPQRMCQELRGVLHKLSKLEGVLKQNGIRR
jgi:hypothetical protein